MTNNIVDKFLDLNQPMEINPLRLSTMAILLKGARKMAGRNLMTGEYEMNEFTDENFEENLLTYLQFTSLINYLIFLEQIGALFKPKNSTSNLDDSNEIYHALYHFSDLNKIQRKAIKSLRNTLTHKFSLATENKGKHSYRFSLSLEKDESVVTPKAWNGIHSNKSDSDLTTIYVHNLIELIESIYKKVISLWQKNNLDLRISLDELKSRFTIIQ